MIKALQARLLDLGFDPGPIDGVAGNGTSRALTAFFAQMKLPLAATAAHGVLSIGLAPLAMGRAAAQPERLPWIAQARKVIGLSEVADNTALRAFLRSDGTTLGDPAKLPWCGDFVQTCIKLALPNEPFPGKLGQNPYWALNWLEFGKPCAPAYGAIGIVGRAGGGHVFFLVGEDDTHFYALGGNQDNAVIVTRIQKTRVQGIRWPLTTDETPIPLPRMTATGATRLATEA